MQDLNKMTVAELREVARTLGLNGYEKMKKDEVFNLVMGTLNPDGIKEQRPAREASPADPEKEVKTRKAVKTKKEEGTKKSSKAAEPAKSEKPLKAAEAAKSEKPPKAAKNAEKEKTKQAKKTADTEKDSVAADKPGKTSVKSETAKTKKPATKAAKTKAKVKADVKTQAADAKISAEDEPAPAPAPEETSQPIEGIFEHMETFGFIRSDNYMPGDADVYISPQQAKKYGLRTGDIITGTTRERKPGEKFPPLLSIEKINGITPEESIKRLSFEKLTPVFPNERIKLEAPGVNRAMRIVDLVSPIGKGQRGMIVSPPKAGKTTLLKDIAKSVTINNPEMKLIILLIDERPEEVTDIKESIEGPNVEVIYSTFDELPEHHKRVSEMVLARAKRLVEQKYDVMILLDSITRLSRAYNLVCTPSGRTLSGGLDPAALYSPKKFFGAARNMREGGSLTVLATALIETGSRMDEVIFEEFKGTGNMELVLDRKMSERRIFPAIDMLKSGTRRDDLLMEQSDYETMSYIRRSIAGVKPEDATEMLLDLFAHTKTNTEFINIASKRRWNALS